MNTIEFGLQNTLDWTMHIAICVVFALSVFWNLKYVYYKKWEYFHSLKLYNATISFFFFCAYLYLIILQLASSEPNISEFEITIVRPLVLLLGGSIATSARARANGLDTKGGIQWKFLSRLKK